MSRRALRGGSFPGMPGKKRSADEIKLLFIISIDLEM
jgi:hypothetical protein